MKIGCDEGCNYRCNGHTVMRDLELCERYGFDTINLQWMALERDIERGICTIEEIGDWFRNHRLKMLSYSCLLFFNMKQTEKEMAAVLERLDRLVEWCGILDCPYINVVPSDDMRARALRPTRPEIRADAIEMLGRMVERIAGTGVKLSLEPNGFPDNTINRFEDGYAIVQELNSPLVGLTMDEYHFTAMGSDWSALEQADGEKIFLWHLDGAEDMPRGAYYNTDEVRLWPGEPGDAIDHRRFADTLRRIGFAGDVCTLEVFRPDYYGLSQEENIRRAAEVTRKHIGTYWDISNVM